MAKLPFLKFNPADFIVDAQTLSLRETGAWIRLICYIWIHSDGTIRLTQRQIVNLLQDEFDNRRFGTSEIESGDHAMEIFNGLMQQGVFDYSKEPLGISNGDQILHIITSRRITRDKKELRDNAYQQASYKDRVRIESGLSKVKVRHKKSEVRSQINTLPSLPFNWFEIVWKSYPSHKKFGRKAAERHFLATVKTEKDFTEVQEALKRYLASEVARKDGGRWVQNGSTWFNNWRDWLEYRGPGITPPAIPDPKRMEEKKAELYRLAELDSERRRQVVAAKNSIAEKDPLPF